MNWSVEQIREAWTHLRDNHDEVVASKECVCVQCGNRFPSEDVREWLNPKEDHTFAAEATPTSSLSTAFCPNCKMDYVLGDASGLPVHDPRFLKAMHS
jgi:hypothetical protein